MLDRLPPEIIDHILLLAAPPPLFDDFSQDSQKTLSRCCMVSKVLRTHAQPLLWRNVSIDTGSKAVAFSALLKDEGVKELRDKIRAVKYSTFKFETPLPADLFNSFPSLPPTLEALFVEPFLGAKMLGAFDARALSSVMASLRIFTLKNVPLLALDASFNLPNLTHLSLYNIHASAETWEHLLSVAVLPSLQILCLDKLEVSSDEDDFPSVPAAFTEQLRLLQVDTEVLPFFAEGLMYSNPLTRTIISTAIDSFPSFLLDSFKESDCFFSHLYLRLYDEGWLGDAEVAGRVHAAFRSLAEIVNAGKGPGGYFVDLASTDDEDDEDYETEEGIALYNAIEGAVILANACETNGLTYYGFRVRKEGLQLAHLFEEEKLGSEYEV